MDNVKIQTQWKSLLKRGASLAKDSLDIVQKQIGDLKEIIHETKSLTSENNFESSGGQLIFYIIKFPCSGNFSQDGICTWKYNHNNEPNNALLLPKKDMITLADVKEAISKEMLWLYLKKYVCCYRFRINVPEKDQKIFSDYLWFDIIDDCSVLPRTNGKIYMTILCLPKFCQFTPQSVWYEQAKYEKNHKSTTAHFKKNSLSISKSASASLTSSVNSRSPASHSSHRRQNSEPDESLITEPDDSFIINSNHSFKSNSTQNTKSPPLDHNNAFQYDLLFSDLTTTTTCDSSHVQQAIDDYRKRINEEKSRIEAQLDISLALKDSLDQWAFTDNNQLKDARTLLCSLHEVLWENNQWQRVRMSELLLMNKLQIKKIYRSAILLSHPDKHTAATAETQYRAHRIFQALNESFRRLKP